MLIRLLPLLLFSCGLLVPSFTLAKNQTKDAATLSETNTDDKKIKTLVVRIEARRKVDPELALALEAVVQSSLTQDETRVVFGQEDLKRIFEFEGERQAMGCTDSNCLAEFANALDADRLVMGTMDKMGKSYLVVLIEIDGKNLQPIGRVQKVISQKEDVLVSGVETLTLKLLSQSQQEMPAEPSSVQQAGIEQKGGKKKNKDKGPKKAFAVAGSIEVDSVPQGALVIVGGEEMGKTPVVLHNLAVGEVSVKLKRKAYKNVVFNVPVYKTKKTKVKAELFLSKKPAEKQHATKMKKYEAEKKGNFWWGLTKFSCGGFLCAGSISLLGLSVSSAEQEIGDPGAGLFASLISGIGGVGFAWAGLNDWFKNVPRPKGDWELNRQIRINPPKGKGKMIIIKTKDTLVQQ